MRNSKLILSKDIRIDKNYNNVLNYTENKMLDYLRSQGHLITETADYSFIDENQISIIVQNPYSQVYNCNYLAFQNPRYNSKWFFCFVDKIEYNSDNTTKISFHTDIWETWHNNLVYKYCYVLREHTANDTIGNNIVDEGLDTGETICQSQTTDTSALNTSHYVCMTTNWDLEHKTGFTGVSRYTNSVWGSMVAVFPLTQAGITNLKYAIMQTNADGHPNEIHELFIVPSALILDGAINTGYYDVKIGGSTIQSHVEFNTLDPTFSGIYTDNPLTYETTVSKVTSFNGSYQPKNNKCYVYPYNYLLVTNNAGSQNIYKYEFFSDASCKFEVQLAMAIGCSGRTVPKNYKGIPKNIDESLPLAKYPTCGWSSDAYTNWLTQNALNIEKDIVNIGFTGVKSVSNVVGNIANLEFGSALMSVVDSAQTLTNQVMDLEGKYYQARLLPNLTGGSNDGNVNFSSLNNGFTYYRMRCNDKYLRIIDNFFTKFGYKVLEVKIPSIDSRKYWNYIQIGAGENLGYGEIPQDALATINQIAQKGVTIWHEHEQIGNYDLNNTIVSN